MTITDITSWCRRIALKNFIEIQGSYSSAKIFTDNIEEGALQQVNDICNQEFAKGSKIRIMPDVHQGIGCVIGTTMTITDKVVPNLVGVDIGCGLSYTFINVDKNDIPYEMLDDVIRKMIPSGQKVRGRVHPAVNVFDDFNSIRAPLRKVDRIKKSLGTLGGGNHFLELNEVEPGKVALVVHSGSRNLGNQIASYYQNLAYQQLTDIFLKREQLILKLKQQGKEEEISAELKKLIPKKIRKDIAYLQGDALDDYLNDMRITQHYAWLNRKVMLEEICKHMGWDGKIASEIYSTAHNYIDLDTKILRKGAISAQIGEKVIIPINMKEGSILANGKGNPDWNCSGPHGAGRVMSRSKARESVSFKEFKESMKDVWTSSVTKSTMDEAPIVYKPKEEIIDKIADTVTIEKLIKPVYNYKAN
ncbi:RtcB family protein [Virgibacillus proomii]|uniref:RtcB family protein n=1 Tax=Virgibacillus proomii TaxID=84407 RepID=UPI0009843A6E|nr:RtcB family protein [Virgibacillus proomii]